MSSQIVWNLRDRNIPPSVGRKASNLRVLLNHGFRVPSTLVIHWEMHDRYRRNDESLVQDLRSALAREVDPTKSYAVRSSANLEDGACHSFAGQFMTVLDVKNLDQILAAARSIWESADSPAAAQYLAQLPDPPKKVRMAVIVQEMVAPVISGIAFSRNPTTGADEFVVEAIQGCGEKLVQSGYTPGRWIYKWGEWIAQPEDKAIPLPVIQQVVDGTKRIVKAVKKPVDLEWVYDGKAVSWVQMRDITTLQNLDIYSNRLSNEMMPGQILPLIWSINIPLIIPVWINLLNEMVGETHLTVADLAKQFYHRSYFNMGALGRVLNMAGLPSEGLEMMMGVVPKDAGRPAMRMNLGMARLAPRLLRFLNNKWTFDRLYTREFPGLASRVKDIPTHKIPQFGLEQCISGVQELFDIVQKVVFFNIHVPLLLSMYTGLLSSQLRKLGVQPEHFILTEGMQELEQYSPNSDLRRLHRELKQLPASEQERILASTYPQFLEMGGVREFQQEVDAFLEKFGHLSDNNNNFSFLPWREQPEIILQLIHNFPDEVEKTAPTTCLKDLRKKSPLFWLFYRRARQFCLYRDQVSNVYTYAYGLFRPYFMAIAKIFASRGWLEEPGDIFYLDWQEIQAASQSLSGQEELKNRINQRKAEMKQTQGIDLPSIIYGDDPPPIVPASASCLRGTPTSPGYFSGPVCTVRGIEDFAKVKSGDVLVVPFSEVGWTPLFVRAGAVVSESGGMLSHSSIIAREYRIPAVVSVPGAMKLSDQQRITVDGYKGEILIHS